MLNDCVRKVNFRNRDLILKMSDIFCLNQMYKMTTTQPVVGVAIEQSLDFLEESEQI